MSRVQRLQNSTGLIKTANNFSLGVSEDDIEELLEVVAKNVGSGTGYIAEEEAREKEIVGKREESPRIFTTKCLAGFADLNKLLRRYKNMDPNAKKFLLIERNVHGELSASKEIYDEKNKPSKSLWIKFWKQWDLLKKHQSAPSKCIPEESTLIMHVIAHVDLLEWQNVEGKDNDIDDLVPICVLVLNKEVKKFKNIKNGKKLIE